MNGVGRGENKQNKSMGALLTRETIGMTLLLFSAVMLFICATGGIVFGEIGIAITAFFVGFAGFFVYPLLVLLLYVSVVLVFGKKPIPARWVARVYFLLAAVFLIVQAATAERYFPLGFGGYMNACWTAAGESAASGTGGGVLLGLIAYPVRAVLSAAGSYILYALLVLLALYLIALDTPLRIYLRPSTRMRPERRAADKSVAFDDLPEPERAAPHEEAPAAPVYGAGYGGQPAYPEDAPVYPAAPAYPGAPVYGYPADDGNGYPAPSYRAQTSGVGADYKRENYVQPPLSAQDAYERSREILFRNDPAKDYQENLIFDSDSRFNTYPRRSSVGPVGKAADADKTAQGSYTRSYAVQAEETPAPMPRAVERERGDDLNYPPSYRAPDVPLYPNRDVYSKDVPFDASHGTDLPDVAGGTSVRGASRPVYPVRDVAPAPPPEERTPVSEREPAAPVVPPKPSYPEESAARTPYAVRGTNEEPLLDSVKSGAMDGVVSEEVMPPVPDEPAAPEAPQPAVPVRPASRQSKESAAREQDLRNLFSRPVEERTHIDENVPDRFDRNKLAARRTAAQESGREDAAPAGEDIVRAEGSSVYGGETGSAADLFGTEENDADFREETQLPVPARGRGERSRGERALDASRAAAVTPAEEPPAPQPQKHKYKAYVRPNLADLSDYNDSVGITQEEIADNSETIMETLRGFRVEAEVVGVTTGATVTRYDIDIPRNVGVTQVIKRDAEVAMRLHARDGVNIYSNSEKGTISIEVPNSRRATVGLKSVMQSEEYVRAKPGSLMFAVGQDVEGRNVCGNIVKMTHILVAGSTNSGKSVCLDAMIISLLYKYSPEELRLILIDPKKTEFIVFDGLPHLMINEIISDAQKAVAAFNWAIKEMERRYDLFEKKTRGGINVRNIDEYNVNITPDEEKLPKIVIVVDELADLMSVAKKDIEERIQRLTQKARAAGIHLVLATQRPSVDVITGVIKGNLPTRMALRVISDVDSRTILDESGAQKLLGNGDMLFRTGGMFVSKRVQGAFVSAADMQRVVEDVKAHNEAYFDESVAEYINKTESGAGGGGEDGDDGAVDPLYIRALKIVVDLGQASISLIQRKCSVGYNHAGKIIEWMDLMGYISPFDGKAKARSVLLTKEEFQEKYGDIV